MIHMVKNLCPGRRIKPAGWLWARPGRRKHALDRLNVMKYLTLCLWFALLGCGCSKSTSAGSERQIRQWVPVGTSLASARQILEQHEFACTVDSYTSLAMMQDDLDRVRWKAGIIREGRFEAVTNISHVNFKNQHWAGRLTLIDDRNEGILSLSPQH
jgi:hypothetical protein